jgi:tRNA A22 N-methylase
MPVPHLDARLSAAAALVRPGEAVADIGCDHGKLTAYLAASGHFPHVIGADLRPGPLAKARKTLSDAGLLAKAELRLGDGLSVLRPGEVGSIIIAGVSARTTTDILSAAPWIFTRGGPRLILIPATKHAVLRGWLLQKGFALIRDIPVQAAGRWYAVMAAEFTGEALLPEQISLAACLYGKTTGEPGAQAYQELERAKLQKVRLGLAESDPLAKAIDTLPQQVPAAQIPG